MDVDVKGAMNIKKHFGDQALTIFILPPSMEELENRLRSRNTDTEESIAKRLEKADFEMSFADRFDIRIINDSLDDAVEASAKAIKDFADNTEK